MIKYRGINKLGIARTGVSDLTPDVLAYEFFSLGFRALTITRDDQEVGGIARDEYGRRTWWGEKA